MDLEKEVERGTIIFLHFFAHVSGGDALHQMKTGNRNLPQNLAVRAVHAAEVKRKSPEKGEGEFFS